MDAEGKIIIDPVLVQGTTSSVVTVYAVPERHTESS
jgi:hypothetical protein